MTQTLLSTKFFVPLVNTGWVPRPRLVERLDSGLERILTLVSAPPGFGKTSLLAGWARGLVQRGLALGWLGLDQADNDPARFWAYLTAALRPVFDPAGEQASARLKSLLSHLDSIPPPAYPAFLDALINDLAELPYTGVLVLDDYHVLSAPLIHEGMTYLVEHLPPNLHIVIATRADPPLPFARLRARDRLVELRAADLRFTAPEADAFFERMIGYRLSAAGLAALEASTEGWIAGLQMAALSMAGQEAGTGSSAGGAGRLERLAANFSGRHAFVLDFLAEEVFNRQPAEIQSFLLHTSILERFNAPLCAAVAADSLDGKPVDAHALLERLERANLFLVPLDNERNWYRYHHLFADLLRVRLNQIDPGYAAQLHIKAASWLARQGLTGEAIEHSLAARDWEQAAWLLESGVEEYLERGQLTTVMNWVRALPKEAARHHPRLTVRLIWSLLLANQIGEAGMLAEEAQAALSNRSEIEVTKSLSPAEGISPDELNRMQATLLVMQGFARIVAGEPAQALDFAQRACDILPEQAAWEWGWVLWLKGYALRSLGDLPGSARCLEEAVEQARSIAQQTGQPPWSLMVYLNELAVVYDLWGRLRRSEALNREALRVGQGRVTGGHGYLSRVEANLAQVLLEQNQLNEALAHAQSAVNWTHWWPSANHRVLALAVLGQVRLALGDLDVAQENFLMADDERRRSQVLGANNAMVDDCLVSLWLAREEIEQAAAWADEIEQPRSAAQPGLFEQVVDGLVEIRLMAYARARLAQKRPEAALQALERAASGARQAGRTHRLVEILVLQAEAHAAFGSPLATSLQLLSEALQAAGEEGFVRSLIDRGQRVKDLLLALAAQGTAQSAQAAALAAIFPHKSDLLAGGVGIGDMEPAVQKRNTGLLEPLTERELEVLRLMSQGLSNRAMAERLYVSEGTIKTHVHNLIGKLEASSRTHAVARGRELGLLST